MNCNSVQTRLSAYLDRELTGSELLDLRAHLAECRECRAEETELRNLKTMLGGLEAPQPSDDLCDRLCCAVLQEARKSDSRWTWRRSVLTFGTVAAASMLVTFFILSLRGAKPEVVGQDVTMDVARHQAYDIASDPMGAPVVSVANYASGR
jgi:predicted anti-sigma-YlaC factor YlaD